MKTNPVLGLLLILVLAGTGCDPASGIATRIAEKSAVFTQLTPEQKAKIEQGVVEIGFTADMVYMAMGRPQKITEKQLPAGQVAMWTYRNFLPTTSMSLLTVNHPSRHGYSPGQTSANAPRNSGAGNGPEPSIDGMPDLPLETLHVFLLNDRVCELKVES